MYPNDFVQSLETKNSSCNANCKKKNFVVDFLNLALFGRFQLQFVSKFICSASDNLLLDAISVEPIENVCNYFLKLKNLLLDTNQFYKKNYTFHYDIQILWGIHLKLDTLAFFTTPFFIINPPLFPHSTSNVATNELRKIRIFSYKWNHLWYI